MTINKVKNIGAESRLPDGLTAALEAVPSGMSAIFFSGDQVFAALNIGEGSESDPASPSALAAFAAASLFRPENKDLRDELERRLEMDRSLAAKALSKQYDA